MRLCKVKYFPSQFVEYSACPLHSDFQLSEIHPTFALRVRHLLYAREPVHAVAHLLPSALCPLPSALKPKALYLMGVITAIMRCSC